MYSRRDFGKLVFAGVPVSMFVARTPLWAAATNIDVALGASTYSFNDMLRVPGKDNIDDVIRALQTSGVQMIELASANVEPAGPNSGPAAPPAQSAYPKPIVGITPAQIAAAKAELRIQVRQWRLATGESFYDQMRQKFDEVGIAVYAYAVDYDAEISDAEIDSTFRQAEGLGATIITTSTTLPIIKRLAPFADKYKMIVALQNQIDATKPGAFVTPDHFTEALAMSKFFRLKLDIGRLTAANGDAVAVLKEHHANIAQIQLTDHLRNAGRSQKFGDGDSPITTVLALLKDTHYAIPAIVEYDYVGMGSSVEEVRRCMDYAKRAIS